MAQQAAKKQKTTSCFVHQLLEKTKKSRKGQPAISYNEDQYLDKASDTRDQAVHSRLLTKRQLSEMAIGVRELSKKLGSIRLKLKVKTIFLLTKAHDSDLIGLTRNVTEWLLSKERGTEYIVFVPYSSGCDCLGLLWEDMSRIRWNTTVNSTQKGLYPKIFPVKAG